MALDQFGPGAEIVDPRAKARREQERADDLQDAGRDATRLFQNRTVGSGRVQPDLME